MSKRVIWESIRMPLTLRLRERLLRRRMRAPGEIADESAS
jgi:hypothetical protein